MEQDLSDLLGDYALHGVRTMVLQAALPEKGFVGKQIGIGEGACDLGILTRDSAPILSFGSQ